MADGERAVLGPHLGDLDDWDAYRSWVEVLERFERLYHHVPERLVHDAHPAYESTKYARERAAGEGGPTLLPVQHHHAHMASCMAEHGLDGEVLGVCLDGTGYGPDGTVWGGEWLAGGYASYRRLARLVHVPMPGGERAAREPWRMAFGHLWAAGLGGWEHLVPDRRTARNVVRMVERGVNSPLTSSMGRLFDAAAALCGLCEDNDYEARAAMLLERAAIAADAGGAYAFDVRPSEDPTTSGWVVDPAPALRSLVDDRDRGVDASVVARRFHESVVQLVVEVCRRAGERTGLDRVVLSGGVFCNGLLVERVPPALEEHGFRVYRHRRVPPNDGGLCLGQLAVSAAQEEH